jgi:hypothetical protein
MTTVNVLLSFIPLLVMMAGLWINCHCLDVLPKHAYAEYRHHVRWATVFLATIVIQVAFAGAMAVNIAETQYQQSMEIGK